MRGVRRIGQGWPVGWGGRGGLWLGSSCALAFLLAGCGGAELPRLPVHPVEGQVQLKGAPLANALVVLHPKKQDPKFPFAARGQTGPDGKFQVTTYDANDGAPVGEYLVTVECYQVIDNNGSLEPGPNILNPKLASQAATDITVSVKEGPNTLAPIEVDRQ